ncbi:MAG: alpha/beta hydrolase [Clostridia bacterium]|nr:alpha/beta hydrolase [Clostridia bacterium]
MNLFWYLFAVALDLLLITLITSYVCFRLVFYARKKEIKEEYPIPDGEIYEEYRAQMTEWIKEMRAREHRVVEITSFDGLTLRGKYFEYEKGAPIELLLHGYRGWAERDLCGGIERCRMLGHNVLVVDHRASGESDGHVITFGINESRDCEAWIDFILREIDPDAQIYLGGVSMGAATVMITVGRKLPKQVVGAVADCGYTSAREIIQKVIREMKLPPKILYPFVRLGARLFGHFDPDQTSPIEAMKNATVPVLFFHGDTDDFVPFEMSKENYDACVTKKHLVTVKGAGHGLAYPKDPHTYVREIKTFFGNE